MSETSDRKSIVAEQASKQIESQESSKPGIPGCTKTIDKFEKNPYNVMFSLSIWLLVLIFGLIEGVLLMISFVAVSIPNLIVYTSAFVWFTLLTRGRDELFVRKGLFASFIVSTIYTFVICCFTFFCYGHLN